MEFNALWSSDALQFDRKRVKVLMELLRFYRMAEASNSNFGSRLTARCFARLSIAHFRPHLMNIIISAECPTAGPFLQRNNYLRFLFIEHFREQNFLKPLEPETRLFASYQYIFVNKIPFFVEKPQTDG